MKRLLTLRGLISKFYFAWKNPVLFTPSFWNPSSFYSCLAPSSCISRCMTTPSAAAFNIHVLLLCLMPLRGNLCIFSRANWGMRGRWNRIEIWGCMDGSGNSRRWSAGVVKFFFLNSNKLTSRQPDSWDFNLKFSQIHLEKPQSESISVSVHWEINQCLVEK